MIRNVQAPPGFRAAEERPTGDKATEVTISGVGFGAGVEFDHLYGFFKAGNAYTLGALTAHFEKRGK